MQATTAPPSSSLSFWQPVALPAPSHERFIDPASGIRFYPIPPAPGSDQLVAVPGVTSILAVGDTQEDKERLENWRRREIEAGRDPDEGRKRGSIVHAAMEDVIRGKEPSFPDEATANYFSGIERHLGRYSEFWWNERPLRAGWDHCWNAPPGTPDRLARVWSWRWGFAGVPDIGGVHQRGAVILSDLKTSKQPYFRCSGSRVPQHKQLGYKKYKKCVRQLCAYRLALKETIDMDVDLLQILVALPGRGETQMFFVHRPEIEAETAIMQKMAVQFWQRRQGLQLAAA